MNWIDVVLVFQLPYTTTDQDLVDLFNSFGEIERANIQMANGRSRGAGIVQFSSIDAAEAAVCNSPPPPLFFLTFSSKTKWLCLRWSNVRSKI